MSDFDIAIIGAGIAGASLAAELADHKRVLLLERERQPGYHSTGRSSAFWSETYGGPGIQPLTSASGPFLLNPPADFSETSFLGARGELLIGTEADRVAADRVLSEYANGEISLEIWERARLLAILPNLKPQWTFGLWDARCSDIDVAALHSAYLRKAQRGGVVLQCHSEFDKAQRTGGKWQLGEHRVAIIVNAAGAWADDVAARAGVPRIGVQPFRRTMMQLEINPPAPANLPLIDALDGSFYFKPQPGGRIWLSPQDETASPACDAAPEELDMALAIERFGQVVDARVLRIEHKWAGLRSFAPDRLPVIGPDPANPAFFWLAGQGGFGIQTAPAISKIAASMLRNISQPFAHIDVTNYAPDRLR